ncbi:MAG: HD domain-containing phosphohydrolase, partial [Candidatus Desulfatibia sp.]|uniref:HD-GYP domain-containing protein n=1 Tax=Candidatus Desulfatibia sp. TaxID=3101189 RepID=UPI002F2DFC39
ALKSYKMGNEKHKYLTDDEVENLSIRKGTLPNKERKIMENHARMTMKILENLPWPRKLANVPSIAGAHHEKLDVTGYPQNLKAEKINLQSRIMAVSDIFEALSAPDRPYKKPMSLAQAIKVLGLMVEDNHIDKDIVELIIKSGLVNEYANRHLKKDQLDI